MDPLTTLLREIADGVAALPDGTASLIVRALLFFGVTTGLTALAFQLGSRSQFLQVMAFTAGLLAATFLPVEWIVQSHPTFKTSVLVMALVALVFLPARLAFFLTPQHTTLKWLRLGFYGFLLFLFYVSW